ncbi:hypothetical protein [Catenovulum sediminis]|uniref:DUF2175 domain-containing protein n=1 Tax=Catenovulum sediminis TaxID=1740262 RepID=A0ABV1RCK5_9ALTE|nr:hypothetical protein [Catenovulum sediminis]
MRCMFCNSNMLESDKSKGLPVTIPGKGVAHTHCAEADLVKKRVFGNIHLADMEDDDLLELYELVQVEVNERSA